MTFKKKKPVDMSTIFNWFAAIMGISLIVAFDMRIYVDTRTNGTLYELGNESEIKDLEGII